MCSALEAVAEGRIRRLILSVPYRTSKSTLVGVVFPVWCWLRHPATRFLTGSHSQTLAVRDALRARRLLESPLLTNPWGDRLALAPDQYAKGRFENVRAYAAGPPPMVDATLRMLLLEGKLKSDNIRYDKFS